MIYKVRLLEYFCFPRPEGNAVGFRLRKDLELPFVPSMDIKLGLLAADVDEYGDAEDEESEVTNVVYHVPRQLFLVTLRGCYNYPDPEQNFWAMIKTYRLNTGWGLDLRDPSPSLECATESAEDWSVVQIDGNYYTLSEGELRVLDLAGTPHTIVRLATVDA